MQILTNFILEALLSIRNPDLEERYSGIRNHDKKQ
jgi:hypothetical protein